MPETVDKSRHYPDWEPAARASRSRMAISEQITVRLARGTYPVKIVKPLHGDPWAVYANCQGLKVHDWKPDSRAVDRCRRWKSW
jgi:hypothetical protein